ncbi:MAG: hypothetical protein GC189_10810 [Alphaproteobacteria bacterium]|nr:hypothetical protein [Alphaproteobacteria bacterium]
MRWLVLLLDKPMMNRILAALLGAFHAANGLAMLLAPQRWWVSAPGASDTGPYNPHFVADVGFAFLAAGLAFLAFAWRPRLKLAALGASGFVVFHALLHLAGTAHGHSAAPWVDFAAIAAPAFAGLAIVWPKKGDF